MEIREYRNYKEDEILSLYGSVGWTAYTEEPDVLKKGFENSLLILGAYEGEKLLGLIRTVGDGCTILYIQDILIYPEHQRQGIGTALMGAVLDRFRSVRQIVLTTDNTPKTIGFYESLGFCQMEKIGVCSFMKV